LKRLFVGNLSYRANEQDIFDFFTRQGYAADNVSVIRDRQTGESRGFAFVEINDDDTADRAVGGCNGQELMGRKLVINEARPMQAGDRPPRRDGGERRHRY